MSPRGLRSLIVVMQLMTLAGAAACLLIFGGWWIGVGCVLLLATTGLVGLLPVAYDWRTGPGASPPAHTTIRRTTRGPDDGRE